MELIDLLQQAHGGNALGSIGKQFGLNEQQTTAAMAQLAPVIAAGLRKNMAQSPENVVSLVQALQKGNHQQYLETPDAVQFGNMAKDGNNILGHVFGSKDVSRAVAMQAASSSGIGSSIIKKMLPVIASMVLGSLTKKMLGGDATAPAPRRGGGGGLGDILGQVLGGGRSSGGGGGLGDILGQVLGGGRRRKQPPAQPQTRPQSGGGLDDLLNDMLNGGSRSTRNSSSSDNSFGIDEEAVGRSRNTLDDFLGSGSSAGNAADDLLGSVQERLNRM